MLRNSDTEYLQALLKKYEAGETTPAEAHFIETYFNYLDELKKDKDPFAAFDPGAKQEMEQEIKARLLESIQTEGAVVRPLKDRRNTGFNWRVAAAILLVCGAAGYWLFLNQKNAPGTTTAQVDQQTPHNIDRAVLKLANGQEIILDSAQGNIIQDKQLTVHNDSGTLNYKGNAAAPEYHTLSTPRGAQYKLQLPDGTQVWMNAASSIAYPTVFTGSNRDVTITGEVYFEVARNKAMPFRVKVNDMVVEVTGTHFNINAYSDEPYLATTLLEGGVKVIRNNDTVTLSPGDQSIIMSDGTIGGVRTAPNLDETMSWKKGYFHFESANLETILRQLSRWYDINITYEGAAPTDKYFVIVKRNISLSAVLKALQANNVQFSMEGKTLKVKAIE